MAFDVSYVFTARDAYSSVARRVASANNRVQRSTREAARQFTRQNGVLRRVAASLSVATRRLRSYRRESRATTGASGALISKFKQFAALAVAGLGVASIIREGAKLEDSLADLSAITGSTGKSLEFLKSQVTALSTESRTLPAEVAMAFKAVASAKSELLKDPHALTEVTRQVLLLKNAAGIDMAQSVDAVASSLNQFGAGADQAARFVNVLAAGSKVGASEVFQTSEAILNAGVAAKLAGLSFEQFNSLIQVMAKNGIKGARSGSELNALLLKMEAKMGDVAPSVIGVSASLKVLEDMNLSAGASMKLFGLESVDVLKILTGNIPLIKQWTKEITGTGIAQDQASKRLGTFNSGIQGTRVQLVNLAAKVFNVARPALVALGGTINEFLAGLDPSDIEAFGLMLSSLGRIAQAAAVGISKAFTVVMVVLKPVLAALKGIGEALGQITGAVSILDFGQFDLAGKFNLGDKFLGVFGGDDKAPPVIDQQTLLKVLPPATAMAANAPIFAPPAATAPNLATVSPAVATANARATVNGQITVSATEGSRIDSVQSQQQFQGAQGSVGLGVAG